MAFIGEVEAGCRLWRLSCRWWWSRASWPRMSVDILGTTCDQCRSMVQCCFMSTETVRLVRPESPHSSWTLMGYRRVHNVLHLHSQGWACLAMPPPCPRKCCGCLAKRPCGPNQRVTLTTRMRGFYWSHHGPTCRSVGSTVRLPFSGFGFVCMVGLCLLRDCRWSCVF